MSCISSERLLALRTWRSLSRGAQSGRHRPAIERASRLGLVDSEAGSIIELLALPDIGGLADDQLPTALAQLGDELTIGERSEHRPT
jgi:hypothetical protein